jgi:hypothetical protein
MTKGIYESRAKDYYSEFRKMVYDSQKQMDKVIGKLSDNAFINQQKNRIERVQKKRPTTEKGSRLKIVRLSHQESDPYCYFFTTVSAEVLLVSVIILVPYPLEVYRCYPLTLLMSLY